MSAATDAEALAGLRRRFELAKAMRAGSKAALDRDPLNMVASRLHSRAGIEIACTGREIMVILARQRKRAGRKRGRVKGQGKADLLERLVGAEVRV